MRIIKKHKRIFYRPGMISLVFIPLLCLYFFYKNDSFRVYGVSNFNVPDTDDKAFQEMKSKYGYPRSRNYNEFFFNNSEESEKNKLGDLQLSLRELKKENDTINGVKIHFGKKTDYAVFVRVIDILYIEDMPTWQPDENNIYVSIGPKNIKKIKYFICGTREVSRINSLKYQELEKSKANFIFMHSFFKKQWILFLGYFGIVLLNIFALIKFNKNQKVS